MKHESLERLKELELELFFAFIECCKKLNISYYLIGGTLLGAVRHKGFIPWDDDIDVGMLRKDYEVFIKEGQKYLPDGFFLQSRKTDPELLNNFAKIRNSKTTFIESSMKNRNINHGIYIDVFPLDYYPDDVFLQKKIDFKNKVLSIRIRKEFSLPKKNKHNFVFEFFANVLSKILSLKYPKVSDALEERDQLYKMFKNSNYIANYGGAWGKKEIVPADWYGEGVEGQFEGIKVRLPKEYDKWLTQVYGDYMQLPPQEKRVAHHYTEVIDTERPYTYYLKGKN